MPYQIYALKYSERETKEGQFFFREVEVATRFDQVEPGIIKVA